MSGTCTRPALSSGFQNPTVSLVRWILIFFLYESSFVVLCDLFLDVWMYPCVYMIFFKVQVAIVLIA